VSSDDEKMKVVGWHIDSASTGCGRVAIDGVESGGGGSGV
jgi:hypothetical protein